MTKSKIIKQLANGEVSIEVALNRIIIIAFDVGNEKLAQWAESELQGYQYEDVPPYRKIKSGHFIYSGINGSFQVTNIVFPYIDIIKKYDSDAFDVSICDGISTIEGYIKKQKMPVRDFTYLNGKVMKETGISCTNISQRIPLNSIEKIVNKIKTILLKILLQLEKVYGCLDELDIDISNFDENVVKETNVIINNYIYLDESITIGNENKIDSSNIIGG